MANKSKANKLKKAGKQGTEKPVSNIPELKWDEKRKILNIKTATEEEYWKKFGVESENAASSILSQMINAKDQRFKYDNSCIHAALSMYIGLKPTDSLEALLISQMVVVHNLAMDFSQRAVADEQTVDGVDRNINRVTKLMRTFTAQVETLKRHRTGGKQTIQVQHVNVNEGGQAVVGNIQGGGGNG